MAFCTKCGQELPSDAIFCHKCGQRVTGVTEAEAQDATRAESDWESDLENAVETAVRSVEDGLQAAFESIGEVRWGKDRFRVEEDRSFRGDVQEERVFFSVENVNGPVRVSTWEKSEFNMDLIVKAWGYTREEADEKLDRIKTGLLDRVIDGQRRLILDIERPDDARGGYSVELDVTLPSKADIDLDLGSSNGLIRASDVKGQTLKMKTSNGRLIMKNVSMERVSGKTSNGRVTLDRVSAEDIDCRSSNGRIEGSVDTVNAYMRTSNGKIDLDLECTRSGEYELQTSNGGIKFKVSGSPEVGYDLDLNTSMSRISVDLPELIYTRDGRNTKMAKTSGYDEKQIQIAINADTLMGRIKISP
jgi:hypothetical protein